MAENFKVIFEDFRHACEADADHHHPAIVKLMELLFLLLDSIAASLAKAVAALSNPLAPTREPRDTNPTPAKPRRQCTPAPRPHESGWLDDPCPATAIPAASPDHEPIDPVETRPPVLWTAATPARNGVLVIARTGDNPIAAPPRPHSRFRPPKRKFAVTRARSITPKSLRYHN